MTGDLVDRFGQYFVGRLLLATISDILDFSQFEALLGCF